MVLRNLTRKLNNELPNGNIDLLWGYKSNNLLGEIGLSTNDYGTIHNLVYDNFKDFNSIIDYMANILKDYDKVWIIYRSTCGDKFSKFEANIPTNKGFNIGVLKSENLFYCLKKALKDNIQIEKNIYTLEQNIWNYDHELSNVHLYSIVNDNRVNLEFLPLIEHEHFNSTNFMEKDLDYFCAFSKYIDPKLTNPNRIKFYDSVFPTNSDKVMNLEVQNKGSSCKAISFEEYDELVSRARTTIIMPSLNTGSIGVLRIWQAIGYDTLPLFSTTCDMTCMDQTFPELSEYIQENLMLDNPIEYVKFLDNAHTHLENLKRIVKLYF